MNIKKHLISVGTGAATGVGYLTLAAGNVFAQDGFIPPWLSGITDQFKAEDTASEYITSRVRLALIILFIIVIIVAIAFSALAGIKFISSSGDSGKMEEAKNAVKAILFGFAAMILAVAGIFLVFLVLGGQGEELPINNNIPVTPDQV